MGTDKTDGGGPPNWPSYLEHLRETENKQASPGAKDQAAKKPVTPLTPQSHQATPQSNFGGGGGLQSFQKSFLDGDFEFVSRRIRSSFSIWCSMWSQWLACIDIIPSSWVFESIAGCLGWTPFPPPTEICCRMNSRQGRGLATNTRICF